MLYKFTTTDGKERTHRLDPYELENMLMLATTGDANPPMIKILDEYEFLTIYNINGIISIESLGEE